MQESKGCSYRHDFEAMTHETFTSAHETFDDLRQKCPVAHSNSYDGFWALLKHEDILSVLKDPRTYVTSVQNVVPKVSTTGRRPPLHLDPPEHTPYRRTLDPFFTENKMAELESPIRNIVIDLLDTYINKSGGDICAEFSHKLPGYVFAEFFNLSNEQSMSIREVTRKYVKALHELKKDEIQKYSLELYEFASQIIDTRKDNPMNPEQDVVSAYLARKYKGESLPENLILGTIRQLIVVGMVAPVVFIGSMCVHLAENPEIQEQLRQDLSLIPAAVEEYLRLYAPYRGFARTPIQDVEINGQLIKKDEPIALVFSSANRDESVFPNGDQFILNRPNIKEHLAFGSGPHRCPGSPLARMMFRITLSELLKRTEKIELAGNIEMTNWPEWGAISVPLYVTPAKK